MFNNTLSRYRFKKIMQFLSFDVKRDKQQRIFNNKFCLASSLWNLFVENSQMAIPGTYVLLTSNYFHVKLDADSFNGCRINRMSLK